MINSPPEVTRLSSKREEKRPKAESGSSSKEGSGKHIDKKKVSAVSRSAVVVAQSRQSCGGNQRGV